MGDLRKKAEEGINGEVQQWAVGRMRELLHLLAQYEEELAGTKDKIEELDNADLEKLKEIKQRGEYNKFSVID